MAERPIYLDHLATTPIDPRVLEGMLPYLRERYGHPGSRSHVYGWEAEQAIEAARARIADLVGADPSEIVLTSGATEADNLAVQGAVLAYAAKGRHVLTSAVEGRPVFDATKALADRGSIELEHLCLGQRLPAMPRPSASSNLVCCFSLSSSE